MQAARREHSSNDTGITICEHFHNMSRLKLRKLNTTDIQNGKLALLCLYLWNLVQMFVAKMLLNQNNRSLMGLFTPNVIIHNFLFIIWAPVHVSSLMHSRLKMVLWRTINVNSQLCLKAVFLNSSPGDPLLCTFCMSGSRGSPGLELRNTVLRD